MTDTNPNDGSLQNSLNTFENWESGADPNPNASTNPLLKMLAGIFIILIAIVIAVIAFLRGTPPPASPPLVEPAHVTFTTSTPTP